MVILPAIPAEKITLKKQAIIFTRSDILSAFEVLLEYAISNLHHFYCNGCFRRK
jgi:hypothetical protein